LLEKLARRHPGSLELMCEIGALKDRGYTSAEITAKIDFTPDYISAICYLLEHGEARLVAAVERGVMPANIAVEIARAPDHDVQQALAEAYENKLLPGNQILAIRRIILRRNQRRKSPPRTGRGVPNTGKITAAALIKSYESEAQRQSLLVKKADLAQTRLTFIVNALRRLYADEEFLMLLRAEAMHTLPRPLAEQLELAEA
jgi:ParB family chromosome partitioning protein